MPKKDESRRRGHELFMRGKSPEEIAEQVNVNRATVYAWIKRYDWKRQQEERAKTAYQVAQEVRDGLPEVVQRFKTDPTPANADAMLKTVRSYKALAKESDLVGHGLQVLSAFAEYLMRVDAPAAAIIAEHIDGFIANLTAEA